MKPFKPQPLPLKNLKWEVFLDPMGTNLKEKDIIDRVGADNGGYWKIIIIQAFRVIDEIWEQIL